MGPYILRRLAQLIPVLIGISLISFGLMYLAPSDPALMMLNANGTAPTPELLEQTRHEMGLDRPFWEQYISWLGGLISGDLGHSYLYNTDVAEVLAKRLPITAALAVASLALAVAVAIPLGVVAAMKRNRLVDHIIQFIEFFSLSMPGFWFGLLLIYVFSLLLGWLPSMGFAGPVSLVLPAIALAFSCLGRLIGQVRAGVIEEFGKPYVEGLISRGISRRRILWRHVLRNALVPTVTMVGIIFGGMLSGAVVIETIFSLPGLGFMATEAIARRDYDLIQAYVVFTAIAYVAVNLAVDLSYHALAPATRQEAMTHD